MVCINNLDSCIMWCGYWVSNTCPAKTFSPSMKGNCIDGIKSFIIRDQLLPKGLKRWWVLVCIFPLNLASANTRKHWKEEDICCVNTDIDPTSITYGGEIKPPTLPRSWAPACANLYSAGRPELSCDGRSIAGVKKNHSESFKSTEI